MPRRWRPRPERTRRPRWRRPDPARKVHLSAEMRGTPMERFTDKVIVITGAGSGLGRECAKWWAEEGGKIVVTDLVESRATNVAKEITDKGGQAISRKVDVGIEAEVEAAVKAAVDEWGRLDIMFANAGKPPEGFGTVPLEDTTEEQWDDVN